MQLTSKTEKAIKRIRKLLSDRYELEVLGNMILTPNCTIEVWKGEITVNEKPAQLDQVCTMVAAVEGR